MESSQHPVWLTNEEGLERSRLTVFFRLLLALPHIVWFGFWSLGVLFVLIFNWFATLFRGRPPVFCHKFLTAYVRYSVHLAAYVSLTGDKFPDFVGRPGSYAIDAHLPEEPQLQNRWKTGFRAILALPAWLVDAALVGGSRSGYSNSGGVLWTNAFLAWWACLFTGRMPEGLRDLNLYALRYSAQTHAYTLLVTDRYPDADPFVAPAPAQAPYHPVRLPTGEDDLTRSRLTVFFRILLVIPHYVWLTLWGIVAFFVAVLGWFATLFTGQLPEPFHNFLTRYVRYATQVVAFLVLAGGPFPGFAGAPGSYPIDVEIAGPERQNRWKTAFRLLLAVPALFISGALGGAAQVAAVGAWFVSLFTARVPLGLRALMAWSLRYQAQVNAYCLLLTDTYPFSAPGPCDRAAEPSQQP
jgi:hypothetical protein